MQGIDSEQMINDGYFLLPEDMWADIAAGDKIRYSMKSHPGATYGGTVGYVMVVDGERKFRMSPERQGGNNFIHSTSAMTAIWKKYAAGSAIEFKLITISLLDKKKSIAKLEARVEALELQLSRAAKK